MAITAAQLTVEMDTKGVAQVKLDLNDVGNAVQDTNSKGQGFLSNVVSTATGMLSANIFSSLAGGIKDFGMSMLSANADAEAYRNQLNIAVGDTTKAGEVFDSVKKMAADTPFEFPELVQGAANLEALGQSAQTWLPIIGDTAAATNKSIDQTVQAVLDAQTGEFERLKEFGIRSKVEGDKVKFSFMQNGKEMVIEADNTSEGISSALMGIWDNKYDGAMETMSNTFTGRLSTLKDNVSMILQDLSKPFFDFASEAMGAVNEFFSNFSATAGQGLSTTDRIFTAIKATILQVFGPETGATINGVIDTIITAFNLLSTAVTTVAGVISTIVTTAFSLLMSNMDTIKTTISTVADVINATLVPAFTFLFDNIQPIAGAIAGVVVAMAAVQAWTSVTTTIQGVTASFQALKVAILGVNPVVAVLVVAAAAIGAAYATNFLGFRDAVNAAVSAIAGFVAQSLPAIQAFASTVISAITGQVIPAFQSILAIVTPIVQGAIGILTQLGSVLVSAFQGFLASGIPQQIGNALTRLWDAVTNLWDAISPGIPIIATVVGALLLIANPVGLAVVAIGGLVAALTTAYQSSETFRNIVNGAFDAVGVVIQAFMSIIGVALLTAIEQVTNVFNLLAAILHGDVSGAFSALGAIILTPIEGLLRIAQVIGQAIIQMPILGDVIRAIIGVFTDMGGALQGASDGVSAALQAISSAIAGGLQAAADAVSAFLGGAWNLLTGAITAVVGSVIAVVATLVAGFTATFSAIAAVVTSAMAMIASVVSTGWAVVSAAITSAMALIQSLVSAGWAVIQSVIGAAVAVISGVVSAGWSAISGTVSSITSAMVGIISSLWAGLQTTLSGIVSAISGVITSTWDTISSTVSGIVSGFLSTITGLWNDLLSSISDVVNSILSTVTGIFSDLASTASSTISGMVNDIVGFFSSLLSDAQSTITSVKDAIVGGFNDAKTGAVTAVTNLATDIKNALFALIDEAKGIAGDIGGAIVDGITGSLTGGAGKVKDAIGGVVGGVTGKAKSILGINSPSRVFAGIGDDTIAGLVQGITRNMPSIAAAVGGVAATMTRPDYGISPSMGGTSLARLMTPATPAAATSARFVDAGGSQSDRGGIYIENLTIDLQGFTELMTLTDMVQDFDRARDIVRGGRS